MSLLLREKLSSKFRPSTLPVRRFFGAGIDWVSDRPHLFVSAFSDEEDDE